MNLAMGLVVPAGNRVEGRNAACQWAGAPIVVSSVTENWIQPDSPCHLFWPTQAVGGSGGAPVRAPAEGAAGAGCRQELDGRVPRAAS